jgi:hypothetical protein
VDCGAGGGALVVLGSIRVRNDKPLKDRAASNQARMCESSVVQAANPMKRGLLGGTNGLIDRSIDRSCVKLLVLRSFKLPAAVNLPACLQMGFGGAPGI